MVTTAPLKSQQRRERRAIPPFGDGTDPNAISNILDNLLAKCRFAPFAGVKLSTNDAHFLSEEEPHRPLEPQFEIIVDSIDGLSERLGVGMDDLELGLSVRNRHLHRYEVIRHWKLDSIPTKPWSPSTDELKDLQSGRGMDFILAIRVVANRERLKTQGLDYNKVLSRRVFSVRELVDTATFPFQWVEFGGETDYPEEALWVIERKSLDEETPFNLPVRDVLTVLVNHKAQNSLLTMDNITGSNGLAWRMLAAEITTQIWADVLTNIEYEPDESDTETLGGQVFANLSRASELPYADVKGLVEEDEYLTKLRNCIARILKVVE